MKTSAPVNEVERLRARLAGLHTEREKTAGALAAVERELETVVDERRAVELVGLQAARRNRLAQLDAALGETSAELKAAEDIAHKARVKELRAEFESRLGDFAGELRELYATIDHGGELAGLAAEHDKLEPYARLSDELVVVRDALRAVLTRRGYRETQTAAFDKVRLSELPQR